MTRLDTERIRIASRLDNLAADFENEATQPMWAHVRIAAECIATGDKLHEIARLALRPDGMSLETLDAFIYAGRTIHGQIMGARKLFETLGAGGPL